MQRAWNEVIALALAVASRSTLADSANRMQAARDRPGFSMIFYDGGTRIFGANRCFGAVFRTLTYHATSH